MIIKIIDFMVAVVTRPTLKKSIGGLLWIIGLGLLGLMLTSGDPNKAVLLGVAGLTISGVGSVVVLSEVNRQKTQLGFDETKFLSIAYKEQAQPRKLDSWNQNQNPTNNQKEPHS